MKTRIIGALAALVLAVVGAFFLVTYVRGADARAAEGAELVDVYVVRDTIPEGTPGESINDLVRLDTVPARNLAQGTVTDLTDLTGLVANEELMPGEQLLEARFVDPATLIAEGDVAVPEGMQEVTISLSVDRMVGGVVRPGSRVGVVYSTATKTEQANEALALSEFIFHQMLVTRVTPGTTVVTDAEQATEGAAPVDSFLITLAATTPEVEKLVYGAEQQLDGNGGLWLTLQNEKTDTSGSALRSGENIYG
jgi:Flp pilus assembly protein CpaB